MIQRCPAPAAGLAPPAHVPAAREHPFHQALAGLGAGGELPPAELYVAHLCIDPADPWGDDSLLYCGRKFEDRHYLRVLEEDRPHTEEGWQDWWAALERASAPKVVMRLARQRAVVVRIAHVTGVEGDEEGLTHSLDLWAKRPPEHPCQD